MTLTYLQAKTILEQYREAPRDRAEQIRLLQLAGYAQIKGRGLSLIPQQELFQVAKKTRELAQRTIRDFLVNEAAQDQFQKLYALFEFDPHSSYAPDPEELEARLLD